MGKMSDFRFNQYGGQAPQARHLESRDMRDDSARPKAKSVAKPLFLVLVILALIAGGYYYFFYMKTSPVYFDANASEYYAVFLTNGQVYFGIPMEPRKGEFAIRDVYYLQVTGDNDAQAELNETRFTLAKLGQRELHGPTDKLFINRDNILFYEQLRKDSRVVASITDSKK